MFLTVNACSANQLWRAGCDFLELPRFCAPYPFRPTVQWQADVAHLPGGRKLLQEHYCNLERLMSYTDPSSAITREAYHGLVSWSSEQATSIWPAGSLDAVPEDFLIQSSLLGPQRAGGVDPGVDQISFLVIQ